MRNYVLVSSKEWHNDLFKALSKRKGEKWSFIRSKGDFNTENLVSLSPSKVFIPHWSHIIPEDVFNQFECI